MDAKSPRRKDGKKSRRDSAHASKGKTSEKQKRTITLGSADWERLEVHAVGMRLSVSKLIETLCRKHCRRFSLHDLGEPSGEPAIAEEKGAGEGLR